MAATPFVSVMVVIYNHDQYVEQALDRILAQRVNSPWEVVVADDCSIDGTAAILARYQQRYPDIVRVLPVELGVSRNFERAMQACLGKFVAIVEGDDYWTSPDKLQLQAEFMQSHPDFSMCFHNAEVIGNV
ncbi:glycosyltransferase family 2 protein [Hymenobacter cellulosivorans]|uniref:Glycosyltransferase n=1 Tax=Hymenobacter cellulosivorans TaxID=2932249 RepID=A0ABY4FGT9_9BACT|nr:glycosyltransferase [Hymenobacter cellulosivorans]UOQ55172.1 glycosyltransferase [Hymenobacter cellulosivorans]